MDGVRKAYQVLAQVILRDFKLTIKIKTKWVGKAEQSFVYFLLKRMYKSSLEFLLRDYKWSQEFLSSFRDSEILQKEIS